MPLPTTFATLPAGNQPASLLDNNFNALGSIAYVPGVATGTNSITITLAANTPTVAAYSQLQGYTFVAAASSTGSITIQVGVLTALPAYKPTVSGPTQAGSGDVVSGVYYAAIFDQALNTGSGGFHLINVIPAASSYVAPAAIAGLLPTSVAGTNTTASMTITSGIATNDANAASMTLASNQAWSVTNGNAINGYQGGGTLPNSTTIHFFLCQGGSGVGTFASNSLSPTLPSGFNTFKRRMFSIPTDGAGALRPGTAIEVDGGSLLYYLTTQILDGNNFAVTTARQSLTLTVPGGIKVQPLNRSRNTTVSVGILFTSLDETDVAVTNTWTTAPGADMDNAASGASNGTWNSGFITTNTSSQIGVRGSGASNLYLVTRGWRDFRRS